VLAEKAFVGNGVTSMAPRILSPSMTITRAVEFLVYNILKYLPGLLVHRDREGLKNSRSVPCTEAGIDELILVVNEMEVIQIRSKDLLVKTQLVLWIFILFKVTK
jgi:hypothetical protein